MIVVIVAAAVVLVLLVLLRIADRRELRKGRRPRRAGDIRHDLSQQRRDLREARRTGTFRSRRDPRR